GPDELRDRAPEVVERAGKVGALANQELVPAAQLLELGQRGRVHVAQAHEANAQRLHARRTFLVPPIVGRRYLRERLRAEAVALGQLRGQVLERKTALGHGDVQARALLARRLQPLALRVGMSGAPFGEGPLPLPQARALLGDRRRRTRSALVERGQLPGHRAVLPREPTRLERTRLELGRDLLALGLEPLPVLLRR